MFCSSPWRVSGGGGRPLMAPVMLPHPEEEGEGGWLRGCAAPTPCSRPAPRRPGSPHWLPGRCQEEQGQGQREGGKEGGKACCAEE